MALIQFKSLRTLFIAASLALGATVAYADGAREQAQRALAAADDEVTAAQTHIDQMRTALDDAKSKSSQLSHNLQAAGQQLTSIRQRMQAGEVGLRQLQAKATTASAHYDARRREMAVEDLHYAPLKDAFEQAKLNAIREFNASPQYRNAVAAVTMLANELRTTQEQTLRRLATSDQYREAFEAMQHADAAANDAGPGSADATKQVADARSQLDALCEHALAEDHRFADVQGRLSAAKSALDELRRRFMELELPQLPQVAAAEQRLKGEATQYDTLALAADKAEKELAEANAAIEQQKTGLAADSAAIDRLTADMKQLETEVASAQQVIGQYLDEIDQTTQSANAARQSREDAADALAQLDAPSQAAGPATVYQYYYPSATVYPSPSTVYVYPRYSGQVYLQARGGISYGGFHRSMGHSYIHHGHSAR